MKSSAKNIEMTSFDDLFNVSQPSVENNIREHGVLVPGIARPRAEGGYELIAGHRRRHASELAGRETMPSFLKSSLNTGRARKAGG